MAELSGNDYIAQILKDEGVEYLMCFPSNPLISAVAKVGIRPVAFRHERGAVMAADGYSRMMNREKFGVVAVQSQAGAENALGGMAQAYADNVPILVMLGGVTLNQIGVRPNFTAVEKYRGFAKQIEAIYDISHTADVMRRAMTAMRNGTPGPVVVELTADVCSQMVPVAAQTYMSPVLTRSVPEASMIAEAAKALLAAEKPMIWAGAGVLASDATAELKELAELIATPVFTTMPGKSAIDEDHPLALGAGVGTTTLPAYRWLNESDVMIALGSSLTRTPYGQHLQGRRAAKFKIHNTVNPDDVNSEEYANIALVGDTKLCIIALIEEIKAQTGGAGKNSNMDTVSAEVAKLKALWLKEWESVLQSDEEPISYYRVIHEMNENLDLENSIVTHDAGAPRDCIVPFYKATTPHSYIGWGKTTHLGFGIPLMIGAKMAAPDKFCCNLMGDGAFGMSGTDIETAARSGFAITTVLVNNSSMATYAGAAQGAIGAEARQFPTTGPSSAADGQQPTTRPEAQVPSTAYGVSMMNGDYATIAQGMGAVGITCTKVSEVGPALVKARELNAAGTTCLIQVQANVEERRSNNFKFADGVDSVVLGYGQTKAGKL